MPTISASDSPPISMRWPSARRPGKYVLRERLVHDRDRRRAVTIRRIEFPALQNGNRERLEIARPDAERGRPGPRNIAAAGRVKAGDEGVAAKRHERGDGSRLHSGNLFDPLDDAIRKREPCVQRTTYRLDVEARHDAVIEIEAEIEATIRI